MAWVEIVALLALLQYMVFGLLVAKARGQYGVNAPAVTGHPMFERQYRVQMNTLEQLAVFLPALWLAAQHVAPAWVAAAGLLFVVGRTVYALAYVKNPASRTLGFALGMASTVTLLVMAGLGALRSLG